jgi:hypothetical protein
MRFKLVFGVILLSCMAATTYAADMPRLPRSVFDVIPSENRVTGWRGSMSVRQPNCRIGNTADLRRRIVNIAIQEWAFFGFHTMDASGGYARVLPAVITPQLTSADLSPVDAHQKMIEIETTRVGNKDLTIAGYWSATPDGAAVLAQQNAAWNAVGGRPTYWVQPWSAAFMSWVMCEGGLGNPLQFQRSIAHRDYVDQGIRTSDGQEIYGAYTAYNPGARRIEPGDLLCTSWGNTNYHDVNDRRMAMGGYASTHCDIVVKVTKDRVAMIGGNVMLTVMMAILPLTQDAGMFPHPTNEPMSEGARPIFVHLKLRATPIEANALDNSPTVKALKGK